MAKTPKTPPLDIVARARQLGEAIEAYAQRHREATLAEHEAAVRAMVQAALGDLLLGVVQTAIHEGTPGTATRRQPCAGCRRQEISPARPHSPAAGSARDGCSLGCRRPARPDTLPSPPPRRGAAAPGAASGPRKQDRASGHGPRGGGPPASGRG